MPPERPTTVGAVTGSSDGGGLLHPDRLLPAEPGIRAVARDLYAEVAGLPIIAVHGHVDPDLLAGNRAWADPAGLLVSGDHYVLRLLHSVGVPLDSLGAGGTSADPRAVWRTLWGRWSALRGTTVRLWLEHELYEVLGLDVALQASDPDVIFDRLVARLAEPRSRPLALFDRFGLEILSTTDAPGASYDAHDVLQAGGRRVVPTLRPDALTDPERSDWARSVDAAGVTSYAGLAQWLRAERVRSAEHGAVATDHGHRTATTADLSDVEASTRFDRLRQGRADEADAVLLGGHLLTMMAVMALDDGMVMQLHTGVMRDHDGPARARFGSDIGGDFPVPATFTRPLQALLERAGNEPGLRLVVFTVDETAWSRELAPMASYYPGLYLGAPWWFLDAPDAMARHFTAVAEIAGYAKLAGFVDDTRAFCSIPARHDVARRAICSHLAVQVAEHRFGFDDAVEVAVDYARRSPAAIYRL